MTNTKSNVLSNKSLLAILLLSMPLVFSSSLAWSHGDEHHAASEETEFGKPGVLKDVTRTIDISMGDDMRFVPDRVNVKQGETIRFVLKNTGTVKHEMILGTADELREHAEMMKKMPNMKHNDPSSVQVEPGKTGEIIWNFDLAGSFQFACLMPGHLEAGMKGVVTVEASATP